MWSQRSHAKPEALPEIELSLLIVILILLAIVLVTVRRPTIERPHQEASEEVSRQYAEPDISLQYGEKLEERRRHLRLLHHDRQTDQIVIGHRKVYDLLPFCHHPQRPQGNIGSLVYQLSHHAVPATVFVQRSVLSVLHLAYLVLERYSLANRIQQVDAETEPMISLVVVHHEGRMLNNDHPVARHRAVVHDLLVGDLRGKSEEL